MTVVVPQDIEKSNQTGSCFNLQQVAEEKSGTCAGLGSELCCRVQKKFGALAKKSPAVPRE